MRPTTVLVALALAVAAAPLTAQTPQPPALQPPALPDSIQTLLVEFGTLRERFDAAQRNALEGDEQLRNQQQQVRDLVMATVLQRRPHMEELFAVLPQIQSAAVAAEESGDRERFEALVADGRRIQAEIEDAQADAIEQPEVAREIDAFEQKMMEGMNRFDPEIATVLERMQGIAARLEVWMGRGS